MRIPVLLIFLSIAFASCKKDDIGPTVELKSGGSYTSTDITAAPGSSVTVGVNGYKTTDDMNLFYTEVAFDGANTATLVSRVWLNPDERDHFSKDITIHLRNQIGVERWIFNINDAEGRISKKDIRIQVQ
jgi:hypothetical protein